MSLKTKDVVEDDPVFISTFSKRSLGWTTHCDNTFVAPVSSSFTSQRVTYMPFYTSKPYNLARWFWLNGVTVGTNRFQVGIYDQDFNLFAAAPRTLSAGANQVQYATPGIHGMPLISSSSNTDTTTYTTASVTLKAGVMYLMSVENSKASSADAVSSIDSGTAGYPVFTSRSTTQYDTSNAKRVSIWSAVPMSDFTGTLNINFGATQTGAVWALNGFYGVDTATNDGIVQEATGTGNSTTPLATLGAFSSANNATFGAFGQATNGTGAVESASYVELSDNIATIPAQGLQTDFRPDNDTTVSETITSAQWGACAVEIKAKTNLTIPPMRGYLSVFSNGSSDNMFKTTGATVAEPYLYFESVTTLGLPIVASPSATNSSTASIYVVGFTNRSSP